MRIYQFRLDDYVNRDIAAFFVIGDDKFKLATSLALPHNFTTDYIPYSKTWTRYEGYVEDAIFCYHKEIK